MTRPVAFSWPLSESSGWGIMGVAIALHYLERGRQPLLLRALNRPSISAPVLARLDAADRESAPIRDMIAAAPEGRMLSIGVDLLVGFGNNFVAAHGSQRLAAARRIGLMAFEETAFSAQALDAARSVEFVITHSRYNQAILQAHGIRAPMALQGVDGALFAPMPRRGRFGGRFAVFSGGKLEYRKGQDLVLAAFRKFHQRHPEALLVSAWHSPWPELARTIGESPLVEAPPEMSGPDTLDMVGWARRHGIPDDAFLDLGFLARQDIPPLLADMDAALFPNRCEGATNLVANETMACALPTILSANTGHLDLIREGCCLPLRKQTATPDPHGERLGWGDSDVDEMVDALEFIHADPARARAMGRAGSVYVRRERTWPRFARVVADIIDGKSQGD